MPILATGNAVRQHGFTLLELMVVLVIMALTISLAALTIPGQSSSQVRQFGQTLLIASRLAQSEALAQGTIIALELQPHGYRFLRYQPDVENGWQPFTEPELLTGQRLMTEDLQPARDPARRWRWQLEQQDTQPVTDIPRIYFWPDGTLSPFTLQLVETVSTARQPVVRWTMEAELLQLSGYSGEAVTQ
ncbi:MAG: type II secretion system minor pseudopilin GspH [Marinobacterium sp.]|nr:type II secretion system minor pseudopilin GspH [Marinobacterium sp.]